MSTDTDLLDTSAAGPAAIRGGAIRIAAYGVGLVLSVGSAALLFRHLGVDDTGRYVAVLSLVTIAGGLTDAGLVNIGIREYAVRLGADRERLMRSLLGIRIVLTSLGILGAVAFALVAGYESTLVVGTAFAGLGVLVLGLQTMASTPLMTNLRLATVAGIDLLRQIVTVGLIVGLVLAGGGLISFLAIPTLAGALVALAVTAWIVRGLMPGRPSFHPSGLRALLRDTAAYAAASAVSTLYFRIAIIVMSLTASAAQTGYYAASFRIVEVLTVVPALAVGAAFPILARSARDDRGRFEYAVQRTFEVSTIIGAWFGLCLGLAAPVFIGIVAGPSFDQAIPVLRLQAAAMLGMFCAYAATYALLSIHRYADLLYITLAGLVVNLGLTLLLVSAWDARGAAVASAATELTLAVMSVVLLRLAPEGVRLGLSHVPRILVAAGAAIALALVPGIPPVALLFGGSAVFFVVLYLLRAIPPEVFEEVARLRASA